jgi:hypothetical protein
MAVSKARVKANIVSYKILYESYIKIVIKSYRTFSLTAYKNTISNRVTPCHFYKLGRNQQFVRKQGNDHVLE